MLQLKILFLELLVSAGGFDAIGKFLLALRAKPGIAFAYSALKQSAREYVTEDLQNKVASFIKVYGSLTFAQGKGLMY